MDSGTEEDEFALLLEIQYQGACSVMAVVYTNPNELNVGEIKRQAMGHFELYSQSSIWLVYNGRKLQDNELVKSIQGLSDYSKLFMGVTKSNNSPPLSSSPSVEGRTAFSNLFSSSSLNLSSKSPDLASPLASTADPLTNMLSENSEWILELLQTNPRFKEMLNRNPQIRHALSDPSTLKELLMAQNNPKIQQEAMRGHDRALANIENIPGGFNALQQFYKNEMADIEEGLDSLVVAEGDLQRAAKHRYSIKNERVTTPMPNPWSRLKDPRQSLNQQSLLQQQQRPSLASLLSPGASLNGLTMSNNNNRDALNDTDLLAYEEMFRDQLGTMQGMGFSDKRANIKALLETGGNVDSAIERLLNDLL